MDSGDHGRSSCLMGFGDNNNININGTLVYNNTLIFSNQDHHHRHHTTMAEDTNNGSSVNVKAKIMSHPHYPRLLSAYFNCQKIGAPPEVVERLEEACQASVMAAMSARAASGGGGGAVVGQDPALDQFMEAYCEMLIKYEQELSKPFKEAMLFLSRMESQFKAISFSTSDSGYTTGMLDNDVKLGNLRCYICDNQHNGTEGLDNDVKLGNLRCYICDNQHNGTKGLPSDVTFVTHPSIREPYAPTAEAYAIRKLDKMRNYVGCGDGGMDRNGSSEEDIDVDMNNSAVDPQAEDRELKGQLLRKYSGYLGSLKQEFMKKRKKGKLPKEARQQLLDWWTRHYKWPYPSEAQKLALAETTGLDQKQINNWFINQRKRHWKPSEDMQLVVMDAAHPHYFMDNIFGNPYPMDVSLL